MRMWLDFSRRTHGLDGFYTELQWGNRIDTTYVSQKAAFHAHPLAVPVQSYSVTGKAQPYSVTGFTNADRLGKGLN